MVVKSAAGGDGVEDVAEVLLGPNASTTANIPDGGADRAHFLRGTPVLPAAVPVESARRVREAGPGEGAASAPASPRVTAPPDRARRAPRGPTPKPRSLEGARGGRAAAGRGAAPVVANCSACGAVARALAAAPVRTPLAAAAGEAAVAMAAARLRPPLRD